MLVPKKSMGWSVAIRVGVCVCGAGMQNSNTIVLVSPRNKVHTTRVIILANRI